MFAGGLQLTRYLAVVWLLPAVVVVLALLVTRSARAATKREVRGVLRLLVVAYLVAVVAITLWPFEIDLASSRIIERGNWIPFRGTLGFLVSSNTLRVSLGTRDFVANVVLFIPLGLLLALAVRRGPGLAACAVALVVLAFALEVIQGLTIVGRTLDIDDAIACSVGALGALVLGAILRPAVRS